MVGHIGNSTGRLPNLERKGITQTVREGARLRLDGLQDHDGSHGPRSPTAILLIFARISTPRQQSHSNQLDVNRRKLRRRRSLKNPMGKGRCTCGAQMRVLSFITEPPIVRKILEHLHRTGSDPARAPPGLELEPESLVS